MLSFHHTCNIRKQKFRALIETFTTRYQAPEPAPTYPPDWLTSDSTLKTVINCFLLAAVPTLTPQPPHHRTLSLQPGLFHTRPDNIRPLFSPVSTERAQVLPDLSTVTQSLPFSSIEIRTILQQVVNNAVRTALDDMLPGPPGPLGATTAGTSTKFLT